MAVTALQGALWEHRIWARTSDASDCTGASGLSLRRRSGSWAAPAVFLEIDVEWAYEAALDAREITTWERVDAEPFAQHA
ncbi:hypothetical protein ACIQZN_22425 [Streptomyces sp. NPDC097595]|uniref:hypothetical protein n=1 Tax=Streptomyces sp. NPDC097595 TaxID=3366090 RepID=UPI00380AFE50